MPLKSPAAIGRISPEEEGPVTLCEEEYERMNKRSAVPLYACFILTLALWMVSFHWPGIRWAGGLSFFVLMVLGIADKVKRERFFNSIACPHCGQPAGELVRREGFNSTRCSHCRQEGQTDLRVMYFTGPISQRWPR